MEPAQPDSPETTTVPVRRGSKPAEAAAPPPSAPPEEPLEERTLALRAGGPKRLLADETAGESPQRPLDDSPSEGATVGFRQISQARASVPPPAPVLPAEPDLGRGATVSIHQIKRMRALLEAPPPNEPTDSPGMTTVPIRGPTGPRLVPETLPSAPVTEPEQPVAPVPLRRSAPGIIKPRGSGPGTGKPASAPVADIDPKLLCPHCRVKLVSPESLGMCPSCGYCRSLEEGKDKVPTPKQKGPSLLGLVEFCQLVGMVPLWFWILITGIAIVLLSTIYGPRYLPANGPQRAWWGTAQFVLGILLMGAGQVWALFAVASHDERVGPLDLMLLSARVWRLVLERLPQSQGPLWMASWGWALALSALFLCGVPFTGLTSTEEGVLMRELRSALNSLQEGDYQSLQAAARDDVKTTSNTPAPPERDGRDSRASKPCAVIGYTKDANGKPSGLIVATPEQGRLRYAGIVRTGLRKSRELLERLGALEKVSGPTEGGAVWVKPDLSVDVHHSGTSDKGTLNEPNLGGLTQSE